MRTKNIFSDDIKFEVIKHMHLLDDLKKVCSQNKDFYNFCSNNKEYIAKIFLNTFKVEYKDPTNYIYLAHNANIDDYKNENGTWKYSLLLVLYTKSYSKQRISYEQNNMTSFPIYPNMIKFHCPNNDLKKFHVQPKMTDCEISNNFNLKSFPVQPEMITFSGEECGLTSFPIQPKMTHFYGDRNELTSFPIQPKMTHFYGEDNNLSSFPTQPNMKHFEARGNNNLKTMSFQPKIEVCKAKAKICDMAKGDEDENEDEESEDEF
jgi:hypothetical protein